VLNLKILQMFKPLSTFSARWLTRLLIVGLMWLSLGLNDITLAVGTQTNYSRIDLTDREFAGQDLTGGVFVSSEMRGVNFSGANLTNAMLTMAVLLKTNLSGANLTGAFDQCYFNRSHPNSIEILWCQDYWS
jgi:uncharacterized protein YjbI with pentapeptide repeats